MADDNVTPFPTRAPRGDEPFVAEAAHFPYENDEWAADNLPVVRQAMALVQMPPEQVQAYVAMIASTVESADDLSAELDRVAGHLGALAQACEAASGRLAWAKAQEPL
ncbi:MAG: hypothetical protein K2Z25_15320 [Beijerinckiaceae bacterium]|nr:hypothetical protein [Beijerinckiaceae bacterium]